MTVHDLLRATEGLDGTTRAGTWTNAALDVPAVVVTHDSRQVRPGAVFVAVRGVAADRLAYVPHAIAAGAAAIVAERPPADDSALPWLVVPDAPRALALLAATFYDHPSHSMRVLGVTGTNGKTTITFLLKAIFEAAGLRCGVIGTVGYSVGDHDVPATHTTPESPDVQRLLRDMVAAGCGACAMEVSSHALSLGRVLETRFAAGIFTNLTRDHLDFHHNMEDYFAAKRRLFEMLPGDVPAVLNVDDPRGAALMGAGGRPLTYGITKPADVMPGAIAYALSGLEFDVRTPQGSVAVRSRLVGRPNVYNILAAVGTASALGVPLEAIETGLRNLTGVPGRFEVVSAAPDDITVIVDYAHTDDALRNLLETARPMAPRRLITVFGAGGDRDRTKRPLMGMVAARLSDLVVVTSDNPRGEDPARIIEEVRSGADAETRTSGAKLLAIVDRRQAIREAVQWAQSGDLVLIAGKGHEKYQDIGGTKLPFDDVAEAQEALEARRLKWRVG